MAELLIKAVNATHADPAKDARGCYKRGDLVCLFENGHEWGSKELLPPADGGKFVVIKITDITVAQVINFFRNRWNCHPLDPRTDATPARKRIRIDADLLPASVRNVMNRNGEYTTTWIAIRQFVREKISNQTAQGDPI